MSSTTSTLPASIDPEGNASIPGVVHIETIAGAKAGGPRLLIEVPHGADERTHYDALLARMKGTLPADLHCFFHVNTDVGAWALGKAVATKLVADDETLSVVLLRSLIPRTFIDCNRPPTGGGDDLAAGGLTAGIPSYITDDDDRALLLQLHQAYIAAAEAAYATVCGENDGFALVPHTYGPRTMGIPSIGADIVEKLRWACEPEREKTWPLRAEVDLLTRDGDGVDWSPKGTEANLLAAYSGAGVDVHANHTYHLHPSSIGHTWSVRYAHKVLCFEVRRDLIVEAWTPFEEMRAVDAKLTPFVQPLATEMARLLAGG